MFLHVEEGPSRVYCDMELYANHNNDFESGGPWFSTEESASFKIGITSAKADIRECISDGLAILLSPPRLELIKTVTPPEIFQTHQLQNSQKAK